MPALLERSREFLDRLEGQLPSTIRPFIACFGQFALNLIGTRSPPNMLYSG
jgi:hypothetical protein